MYVAVLVSMPVLLLFKCLFVCVGMCTYEVLVCVCVCVCVCVSAGVCLCVPTLVSV